MSLKLLSACQGGFLEFVMVTFKHMSLRALRFVIVDFEGLSLMLLSTCRCVLYRFLFPIHKLLKVPLT